MKIHYRDDSTIHEAPYRQVLSWRKEGLHGTICGYVRKYTTMSISQVTCTHCLNKINST